MADSNQKYINERFVDHIQQGGLFLKKAEVSTTSFIRTVLKEKGLIRKIFTPLTITTEDLDKTVDSDKPYKIVEKEVDTTALSLPFRAAPTSEYITGDRYGISFYKIATKKLRKNIYELKTYANDIRKIITDNALKEIEHEEDIALFNQINTICAAAAATQIHAPGGGVTKANIIDGIKLFQSLVPAVAPGVMVMNNNTLAEILKNFESDDVGFNRLDEMSEKGTIPATLYGWPLHISIKHDVVADKNIYLIASEDFIGKFYILEEPTAIMETKDGDTLEWWFWEVLGLGIGNTTTFVRMTL